MDIVSRLKTYMAHVGLPSTQFADFAGIPRPTISQILNGRNKKISNELIAKLHTAFPTLNILWLMFGDGEMEVSQNREISEPEKPDNLFESAQNAIVNEQDMGASRQIFQCDNNTENRITEAERSDDTHNDTFTEIISKGQMTSQAFTKDTHRKIRYIMVYYDDNTFEVFNPAP